MVFSGTFPAEKRTLLVARNTAGYFVSLPKPGQPSLGPKPYRAPLTSEEARQQAQAEGLILLAADNNKAGYYGVRLTQPGHGKPYQARVIRGSKDGRRMSLGNFATVEEAALCVARSPEGQAVAAARAAAAPPLTSEEAVQQARDATIRAALDIIYEAAGAAAAELCAEVAAEVMAGIALGL